MFVRILREVYDPQDYKCNLGSSALQGNNVEQPDAPPNIARPLRETTFSNSQMSVYCENDSCKFQVMLNVKHFRPDEIKVRTVDNFVVVHCKHEELADEHGYVSREFTRRYQLPDDVEPQTVTSCLHQEGILTIEAPRKMLESSHVRIVPIACQQTAAVEEAQKQQAAN